MNPYCVLGVSPAADDRTIRKAYLDGVKAASPDTDPQRFQALSQAYEKIKDESHRLEYYLFHKDCPGSSPLDVLLRYAQLQTRTAPLPFSKMKEFLRACAIPKNK